MKEMKVTAVRCRKRIRPETSAVFLLERCRAFYQDPENEKAFLEWKAGKGKK